ncbi:MAG TPA: hypothetical protein VKJ47_01755, partial [Candidatus Binatia bacterium]|nr:hypothetical protein [Candidatus Binatia bacterium]
MTPQRAFVRTVLSFFSPQLSLLVKLSRRAVLCCALVGALVCPRQAVADYTAPDYYVSADPTPYIATTALTITFSASDLSDVPTPGTTVAFSMALASDPSQTWVLGQADVPAIDPWQYVTQTVTFPLPANSPAGTTDMQLIANINPGGGNGEVQTDNNVTTTGFEIQTADSSTSSASSTTPTAPADPPAPPSSPTTSTTSSAPSTSTNSTPTSTTPSG